MKILGLIAGAALLVAAASSAQASSTCLQEDNIWNFKALNDRTLIVEDNFHNKFRLNLLGTCAGLTFKEGLAIKSVGGTALSCISAGDSIYERNMGTGRMQCPIRSVEPYTPAMQKADMDAAAAAQNGATHP